MTTYSATAPIVGVDVNGNPITMVVTSDGAPVSAGYVDTFNNQTNNDWQVTEVQSMYKSAAGIVAVGYGTDKATSTEEIAWVMTGSIWAIGPTVNDNSLRPIAITYKSPNYVLADGANIFESEMVFLQSGPAGGFADQSPTFTNTASAADSMNVASVVVGASLSSTGTWVGPTWAHQAGMPTEVFTGHYATTYTYPGASGTALQTQLVSAIPNGDSPVTSTWGSNSASAEGYYGITGSPSLTIEWPVA